jgi:uncharacterized membrane protein
MLYNVLKFVHILLAIIAIGFTSAFGLIIGRAAKAGGDGREMLYALRAIRLMVTIAHGCFVLLLLTGLWMIWEVGFPFSFKWIYWSLILFAIALGTGVFVMAPSVTRRIEILSSRGPSDPEFIALSKRAATLGPILSVIALIIIWLMVAKPL